ncbi:MAG: [FeFe] hydrogenase H-cluster radical SAM maturase HydE [Alphaproteobacteria bacterium]
MDKSIIALAKHSHKLTKLQIMEVLQDSAYDEDLFAAADCVRRKYIGDLVKLIALVEFSNVCRNSCFYCGLRAANQKLTRYHLTFDEIYRHAQAAKAMGFSAIALQSGESSAYSYNDFIRIIRAIKAMDMKLILSCGELDARDLVDFRRCGVDGYLLKIETTDQQLYADLHPKQNWMLRNNTVHLLSALGYYTATGNIIGLRGQSLESIADDLLYFQRVNADFIGIGPLMSHPETPLRGEPNGDINLVLKCMALSRLLNPKADIVTTTALEALAPDGQKRGLAAGANVVMPNITSEQVRKNYQLFKNKENTNIAVNGLQDIIRNIEQCGRRVPSCFKH